MGKYSEFPVARDGFRLVKRVVPAKQSVTGNLNFTQNKPIPAAPRRFSFIEIQGARFWPPI